MTSADADEMIKETGKDSPEPEVPSIAEGSRWRRYGRLLAIKPVLIFYGLQFALTGVVTSQLQLDKACRANLGYGEEICSDLTNATNVKYEDEVQKLVVKLNTYDLYIMTIPSLFISLYLGPWSDRGRKPLMLIPYLGHLLSNSLYMLNVYMDHWKMEYLWLTDISVLFGGYKLLQIAMNGYVGDVTLPRERTTTLSILTGLGLVIFPLADLLGSAIFSAGGYYAVYGTALSFTVVGIVYIYFLPESVTVRTTAENDTGTSGKTEGFVDKISCTFREGNKLVLKALKSANRPRSTPGLRSIILSVLAISVLARTGYAGNTFLYAQKVFGWTVADYSVYLAVFVSVISARTFLTTPFFSYYLNMHDIILAVLGTMALIAEDVVKAFANQSWMLYYASFLTLMAPLSDMALGSFLTKCVGRDEFGGILALQGFASGVAGLIVQTLMNALYAATEDTFPGAQFLVSAGVMVFVLALCLGLYKYVRGHEKEHGPVGKHQEF